MDRELGGKTAFVTGSGRGLGRVMAERLAELGADVAIHDIDGTAPAKYGEFDDLGEVAERIGAPRHARSSPSPATSATATRWPKMKADIDADLGEVHILVNCAGGDIGATGGKPEPEQRARHRLRGHPGR